jgi:NAD-dependent DNA ligase
MHFVFSGFRDKDYEEIIKNNNGIVNDTITKTTNYLVVKDTSKITEKIKKAIEKGIKVISKEEFEKNISQ